MQATIEKMEGNHAHLSVEVPKERVDEALERAYRKIARNILIPGFRKGKAPRRLVERYVGSETLLQEALDELLPEAYRDAVEATGIEPIDRPQVTDVSIDVGKPLSFKAVVEVKPEVTLGDYRAIRVKREAVAVSDEDVEQTLQQLREQQAQLVAVAEEDAVAEKGLFATIDFAGRIDGEPFEGGEAKNYVLEIGAGRLIDGFEDQLVGMKVGEQKDIQVTFPEDYGREELAGKDAVFTVTLHELKRKELPELDDEFAKSVGDFETLAALREDIKKSLTERAEADAEAQLRNQVVEQVVEQSEVDVPNVLVERRIDQLVADFTRQLATAGLTLEDYLKYQEQDEQAFRDAFRERAVKDVKAELVLDAIARKEQLAPTDEELEKEAARLTGDPENVAGARAILADPDVRDDVRAVLYIRKTIDYLVALATAEAETAAENDAGGEAAADDAAAPNDAEPAAAAEAPAPQAQDAKDEQGDEQS